MKFHFIFHPQNLDLDDTELKNLLDEAYSYKGPKDKENKSEIFKVRPKRCQYHLITSILEPISLNCLATVIITHLINLCSACS